MKKILITLFVLTSMIMFMFIKLSFEEKDVSDVAWLFGLNEGDYITLELEGDLRTFDSQNFVNVMYDIHAQTEVTLVSSYSDNATKTEEYYIISDEPLDQMFDLTIYGFILNDAHELIHLSTHNNTDKPMKINLINKEIQLDIYSYNYFAQKDNYPSVSFYYEDESQLSKIQSIVEESLGEYNPQYIDYDQDFYDYKTEIKDQVLYLLVLSIALLFSSLLFFVSTSLYEIGIYKLQGYPSSRIMKMLLLKEVLISIALSIVAVVLLFVFRIGLFQRRVSS